MDDGEQQTHGLMFPGLAARLGVCARTVQKWKNTGLVAFVRVGSYVFVPWPEVERLDAIRKTAGSKRMLKYLRSAASKSLSTTQAARAIGMHPSTLFQWAKAGIINSWQQGNEYRIPTAEVERLRALNQGYSLESAAKRLGIGCKFTLVRWATHIPFEWFPAPGHRRRYDRTLIETWRDVIDGESIKAVARKLDHYAKLVRQRLGLPEPEPTPEEGAPHTA